MLDYMSTISGQLWFDNPCYCLLVEAQALSPSVASKAISKGLIPSDLIFNMTKLPSSSLRGILRMCSVAIMKCFDDLKAAPSELDKETVLSHFEQEASMYLSVAINLLKGSCCT